MPSLGNTSMMDKTHTTHSPLGVPQTDTPTPGNLTPGPPILHIQRCVQVAGWGGDPWSMLPHDHLTSRGTPNRRHTTRSHQHTELGCLAIWNVNSPLPDPQPGIGARASRKSKVMTMWLLPWACLGN